MTGFEGENKDNQQPVAHERHTITQNNTSDNQNNARDTVLSSNISQGAVVAAKEYLTGIFNEKVVELSNNEPADLNMKTVYTRGSIEFVREITEESLKSFDRDHMVKGSEILLTDRRMSSDISEFTPTEMKTVKKYIKNVYYRCNEIINTGAQHFPELSESSLEVSLNEANLAREYANVYMRNTESRSSNNNSHFKSIITISDDNKKLAEDYVKEMLEVADEQKSRLSSMRSETHNTEEDDMIYHAPVIQVIEDKTSFSVGKYLKGVKQEGYEHAFMPTVTSNALKEKAKRLSNQPHEPLIDTSKKDTTHTKPKEEATKPLPSKPVPKEKPKPKVKVSDEDYIQTLLLTSFPQEHKEEKEEETKAAERVVRLNKQATLRNPKSKISGVVTQQANPKNMKLSRQVTLIKQGLDNVGNSK